MDSWQDQSMEQVEVTQQFWDEERKEYRIDFLCFD
jgi:uncharacterized damage-inducible protein DinB